MKRYKELVRKQIAGLLTKEEEVELEKLENEIENGEEVVEEDDEVVVSEEETKKFLETVEPAITKMVQKEIEANEKTIKKHIVLPKKDSDKQEEVTKEVKLVNFLKVLQDPSLRTKE